MTTQADFASLLQKSQELNLKYKTRIIELQNDLNHQKIKARQYQNKFKDALLQSEYSQGQGLIQKLNSKEKELIQCRKQIIDLNRRIANSGSSPTQTDLLALARENQDLMNSIEQIKNAAISAIMMKEQQIEELNKNIGKYDIMESELKFQIDKYQSLQRQFEMAVRQKEQDIKELSEKISKERETYLSKLQLIQTQASQSQHFKQSLLEKTSDLEGTIEKSQHIIEEYEIKIFELQNQMNQLKMQYDSDKAHLQIQIEESKDEILLLKRDERAMIKLIEQFKNKDKMAQENISRLTSTNQQLRHKLTIKKKRDNKAAKDKITSSFVGVVKQNPVYASFAFRNRQIITEDDSLPKNLGDFPEIQEVDGIIENFNFQELNRGKSQQITLKQEFQEIPMPMSKKKPGNSQQTSKPEASMATTQVSAFNQPQKQQNSKQVQNYKQNILRMETQKKQLQDTLNNAYNQLDSLNQNINSLTQELQQERKNIAELRQQMKKTKKESQLIIELQSMNLHVEKLQNDMIASKLKYAQQAEFQRQKYNRQKVQWTQKLVQLTDQIAKQDLQIQQTSKFGKSDEKKKKKGFFS